MLTSGVKEEQFVVAAESLPVLDPKLGDVVEETVNGKPKVKRLAAKGFPLSGTTLRKRTQRGILGVYADCLDISPNLHCSKHDTRGKRRLAGLKYFRSPNGANPEAATRFADQMQERCRR
jgi:hypothetical protein